MDTVKKFDTVKSWGELVKVVEENKDKTSWRFRFMMKWLYFKTWVVCSIIKIENKIKDKLGID